MHEIVVENVGTVYYGPSKTAARVMYHAYAGRYKPWGRRWFADVTWIEGREIKREYADPNREASDRE